MRRIWTSTDKNAIEYFSRELKKHEILHSVDTEKDNDWGSDSYGTLFFSIWAHDDANVERAKAILTQISGTPEEVIPPLPNPNVHSALTQYLHLKFPSVVVKKSAPHRRKPIVTALIFLACIVLYVVDHGYREETPHLKAPYSAPFAAASLRQTLLFDYPKADVLEERLINTYGPDSLNLSTHLPPNGEALREEFLHTPYWGGLDKAITERITGKEFIPTPSLSFSLLFERIREGQLWRLFTPIFLHGNLFHLFFNMLWLIALGRQIDLRLSPLRYLLFIACIACVSNTAQYLMSGPFFLGISGVLCGMIGFIAARQQIAPWEGYHFTQLLYSLLLFFIWALVALSVVSFFLEAYLRVGFPISFGNTAHVTGLSVGLLLGRTRWFRMRRAL